MNERNAKQATKAKGPEGERRNRGFPEVSKLEEKEGTNRKLGTQAGKRVRVGCYCFGPVSWHSPLGRELPRTGLRPLVAAAGHDGHKMHLHLPLPRCEADWGRKAQGTKGDGNERRAASEASNAEREQEAAS